MKYKTLGQLAFLLAAISCGGEDDGIEGGGPECNGAKCDNAGEDDEDGPAVACAQLVEDFSGGRAVEEIMANDDPIAQLVLSSGAANCPMSVADIVEQLKAEGCSSHGSQFVSERSQLLGTFTDYRSVTELKCDGKIVFLHYPILASDVKDIELTEDGPRLAAAVNEEKLRATLDHTFPAIIAEAQSGVFNYYQSRSHVNRVCTPRGGFSSEEGGFPADAESCERTEDCEDGQECLQAPGEHGVAADFRFFGDSMDFVNLPEREATLTAMANALPGPVTTEADIEHSLDIERNCAVCHPGGGVTMRELKSPWVHWEAVSHFSSPQTEELISKASDILGSHLDGFDMQRTVERENGDFLDARIRLSFEMVAQESAGSRTLTTGEILRPLFCTDEFNILTTGSRPGVDLTSIGFRDTVLDRRIAPFGSVASTTHEKFQAELAKREWQLWGFGAGPFAGKLPAIPRETLGTLTFLHRSDIDQQYIDKLIDQEIIDDELLADALAVDFTQGVYSTERCQLVEVLDRVDPSVFLDAAGPKPNAGRLLREALVAALDGNASAGAEADFLANLQTDGTDAKALAKDFVDVCKTRDADALLVDFVDYLGQTRKRAAHPDEAVNVGEGGFLMFRFPGFNGFGMSEAMAQPYVEGRRFDPVTCELINHYPGLVSEPEPDPEPPPAPQPDDDGPGDLSCAERGCAFDPGANCQCDDACVGAGDCCDFDGDTHDGPSAACG